MDNSYNQALISLLYFILKLRTRQENKQKQKPNCQQGSTPNDVFTSSKLQFELLNTTNGGL